MHTHHRSFLIYFLTGLYLCSSFCSSAGASSCASFENGTLNIPCLEVGSAFYSLDLGLASENPMRFSLAGAAETTGAASCATFNIPLSILHEPCLNMGGTSQYWVDVSVSSWNPLTLELSGAGASGDTAGLYFTTGNDMAASADRQKEIGAKLKALSASVMQATVALNQVLYTNPGKTSFDDFAKRRETAKKALDIMVQESSSLQQAVSAQSTTSLKQKRPQDLSAGSRKDAHRRDEVAAGTAQLGFSARFDDIQNKLNKVTDITGKEAQRLKKELTQEVDIVDSEKYASQADTMETLRKTAVAVGSASKVAGMVIGTIIALPEAAAVTLMGNVSLAGIYISGASTLVGLADDYVIFSGGNEENLPSKQVPMLAPVNTAIGVVTLKGDTTAQTAGNILNTFSGQFSDAGDWLLNLGSGNTATTSAATCSSAKNQSSRPRSPRLRSEGDPAGSLCQRPAITRQVLAGNYIDPVTGEEFTSAGLDSDLEEIIKGYGSNVLIETETRTYAGDGLASIEVEVTTGDKVFGSCSTNEGPANFTVTIDPSGTAKIDIKHHLNWELGCATGVVLCSSNKGGTGISFTLGTVKQNGSIDLNGFWTGSCTYSSGAVSCAITTDFGTSTVPPDPGGALGKCPNGYDYTAEWSFDFTASRQ